MSIEIENEPMLVAPGECSPVYKDLNYTVPIQITCCILHPWQFRSAYFKGRFHVAPKDILDIVARMLSGLGEDEYSPLDTESFMLGRFLGRLPIRSSKWALFALQRRTRIRLAAEFITSCLSKRTFQSKRSSPRTLSQLPAMYAP